MASDQQQISHAAHTQYFTDEEESQTEEEEEEAVEEEEEDDEEEEEQRRRNYKSMFPSCGGRRQRRGWSLGQVLLDPKARWVQEWNRVFLLVCATGLFVDPLFFYALSISDTCMCLFVDGWFAITVTALRCMTDVLHVWNMWLQLKMAKKPYAPSSSTSGGERAEGGGEGHHITTSHSAAIRYLKAKKGFFFDLFIILPLPQVRLN